jgi:uncharacterized caspase-like protein
MRFLHRYAGSLARQALCAGVAVLAAAQCFAQAPERRFALVIGNSEYRAGPLPTAANDADLVAGALRRAGFDVAGARDLDLIMLRQQMREFLDNKVSAAGPETVSVVYLAGYALQYQNQNYFVPVDGTLARSDDIATEALRLSDFIQPLAGMPGTVKIVVMDVARGHPFTPTGISLATGLNAMAPDPGMLIAFNATPGSSAPTENGPYSSFAQALTEAMGTGGLGLDELFGRVGIRVYERTNGAVMPWYASNIARSFLFRERNRVAPALLLARHSRQLCGVSGDLPR